MATPPVFSAGAVLTAAQMNAVGMWLVKTDTITSGATKEITGAFSNDFTNYRIVVDDVNTAAGANMFFRFGTSTTSYYGTYYYDLYTGAGTGTVRKNNGAELQIAITGTFSGDSGISFDVYGPNTTISRKCISGTSMGGGYTAWFGGVQIASTQYTSFTLGVAGTTFTTCNVSVYGYRK